MNSKITSILSVIFSLFMFLSIHAQTNTDSLELSLEFVENPKDKIEILLELSNEFKNNDPDKALDFAQDAFSLSEENDNKGYKIKSMLSLAEIYCSLSDFKAAMEYANKSMDLAEEMDKPGEKAWTEEGGLRCHRSAF